MANILDPKFKYRSSFETDVRRTFAKYLRAEAAKKEREQAQAQKDNVTSLDDRLRKALG